MPDTAIVIGIDNYPGLTDLEGPCNDARRFADWLSDSSGGGFDGVQDKMHLCLSCDFPAPTSIADAHPIKAEVEDLLNPLVRRTIDDDRPGGRLFLFAAGHGFASFDDPNNSAVFTAEADQTFYNHIALYSYAHILRSLWAFDEIILLIDACRSVDTDRPIIPPPIPQMPPHENAAKVKTFWGYATGYGRDARETVINGRVSGIFTEALLDALRNAPPNQLGRVTGTAIEAYVHNVIGTIAGNEAGQVPNITAHPNQDVLFLERTPEEYRTDESVDETLYVMREDQQGQTLKVLFAGRQPPVETRQIDGPSLRLRLAPGIYKSVIEETSEERIHEVPGHGPVAF